MQTTTRRAPQAWVYAVGLICCVLALLFGLWNGLARDHWFGIGLFAVAVIGANMAILLRKTLRNART